MGRKSVPEPGGAWDVLAGAYDWQLGLERRAIAAALELADPQPADRLLDVATGTGAVLRALARHRSRPAVAIGVDRSDAMLARVPQLPPGWEVVQGELASLPFATARFDVLVASYLLHLLDPPDLERGLRGMRRVLRPGGRLVTVTPVAPRSLLKRPYELTAAALARLGGAAAGLRPMDPGAALSRSGLEPVRGRYVRGGYPSLCVLALHARGN